MTTTREALAGLLSHEAEARGRLSAILDQLASRARVGTIHGKGFRVKLRMALEIAEQLEAAEAAMAVPVPTLDELVKVFTMARLTHPGQFEDDAERAGLLAVAEALGRGVAAVPVPTVTIGRINSDRGEHWAVEVNGGVLLNVEHQHQAESIASLGEALGAKVVRR